MNRRGHLSHKIPNVKLRPAPAASASRPVGVREASPENMMNREIKRQAWADADHDESPAAFNKVSRPLEGVVITFTGVENKAELAKAAKEMGAQVESALTIHVSHLIASQAGSQKYHYAVMHKLPILAPSWLLACHHIWLSGAEVDAHNLASEHGLPPFVGLRISVSGVEPIEKRNQVQQLIYNLGGIYSKVLDRQCTHLISTESANVAEPSKKVKWALEQNANRMAEGETEGDIAVVYEEWFWDCVHFNGRMPENEYDVRGDRPPSRAAQDIAKQAAIEAAALPVDLPDEKDPVALRKRRRDGMDDLIGELIGTTSAAPAETSAAAQERALSPRQKAKRPQSVLHSSRSNAFAARDTPLIFSGLRMGYAVLQSEEGPMEDALDRFGASVVHRDQWAEGEPIDYLVVRLASIDRDLLPEGSPCELVTECWVESCVYKQQLLDPDSELVYRPLAIELPVTAFERTQIHLTALDEQTAHFARRLIGALGGNLSSALVRKTTTHVISGASSGRKFDKAAEWGIPVVPLQWLYACGRSGELEPVDEYRYRVPEIRRPLPKSSSSSNLTTNLSVMSDTGLEFGAVNTNILPPLDMTDALRQLAERDDNVKTAGWKAVRRARPASRLKGFSHSPLTPASTSPKPTMPSPSPAAPPPAADFDESIRVAYVDPVADKEKRRLMDALRKGELHGDKEASLASKRRKR